MKDAQAAIDQNSQDEQGGVPEVPYDAEEYQQRLIPLMSFVAHIGEGTKGVKSYDDTRHMLQDSSPAGKATRKSVVVLLPLDDSQNAVLSFGSIGDGSQWHTTGDAKLSSGFAPLDNAARASDSTPAVEAVLSKDRSRYTIDWDLDPVTLAGAIGRTNQAIAATANLPRTLIVAVLYDMDLIPFMKDDFAVNYADNLWSKNENDRIYITPGSAFAGNTLAVQLNGLAERKYIYSLKHLYKLTLSNDAELNTNLGVGCTMLEFERESGPEGPTAGVQTQVRNR
jgi:hypothetical protein